MIRQTPRTRRWIRTGTLSAHAANPPATLTEPLTTRCRRREMEIDLWWNVGRTVKFAALFPVPAGVVTLILPVTAPAGTVAVICVAELTAKLVAATPPNRTDVAPLNPVPVIVTTVPAFPLVGEKEVIVGAWAPVTVNFVALVPVPLGVVTLILPVVASVGTVAVIRVSALNVKPAPTLPNFTEFTPVKPDPVIVTTVPTGPLVGEKLVIFGVTLKSVALVALPLGVVTVILPVVAPDGTVAVIRVPWEFTEKMDATTPLNRTWVVPANPVPLMATEVPIGPLVGENDVMTGAAVVTVKFPVLVAVPAAVVTVIFPVTAPDGTVAVIWVPEGFAEKLVAATLPNFTDVTPLKFEPVIVTEVPTGPLVGEKDVIVGAAEVVTTKSVALVAVPDGVVTEIFPVEAPVGTVAVIRVPGVFTENVVAAAPPNFTDVAPPKSEPLMVTEVPTGPLVGEKEVMVGAAGAVTTKSVALVAVPSGVVTLIFPVAAPLGTGAVTLVGETGVNTAAVVLNFTPVTSTKLVPLMVTEVPTGPEVGENEVIVGESPAHAGTASSPRRTPTRVKQARRRRGSRPVFIRCLPTRAGTGPIVALGRYPVPVRRRKSDARAGGAQRVKDSPAAVRVP
jgi:hypothetical protein